MTHIDDFPLPPSCAADGAAFYAAFLEAERFMAAFHSRQDVGGRDRALHELTSHLLGAGKRRSLLRTSATALAAPAIVWLARLQSTVEWTLAQADVPVFKGLGRDALPQIARLSGTMARASSEGGKHALADALASLVRDLAARGIVLVHERAVPGARVDGVVFKTAHGRAVVGLSVRYSRLDHYWFTLMHELAHLVLHEDRLDAPIVDDLEQAHSDDAEREADQLARDALIPREEWLAWPGRRLFQEPDVREFAERIGVAPQVVAGRMRWEADRHDVLSRMVRAVDVRDAVFEESAAA